MTCHIDPADYFVPPPGVVQTVGLGPDGTIIGGPVHAPPTLAQMRAMFNMSDAEIGLGVEPIDMLEAALAETEKEWSDGWAYFGPGGLYADDQNAKIAAVSLRVRSGWDEAKQGKMTDQKVKDDAHADPEYQNWLLGRALDRARYIQVDQKRTLIHARIARGNAVLRASSRGG